MTEHSPLLEIDDLSVEFRRGYRRASRRALDGVDLTIESGESVAVVGESGSGKTTLGNAVLGLVPIVGGSIRLEGSDITHLKPRQRRDLAGKFQAVFQDPYSSLNPAMSVGAILAEPLRGERNRGRGEVTGRVGAMLERVGLPPGAARQYPSDFSGGQRQRIGIARGLISLPRLLICDEPVSSLDVSIQAQILNLLISLHSESGASYLFISHDLSVVRHVSQKTIVLYCGRVMESGPTEAISASPAHPYTISLLDAAPVLDPELQQARRSERLAHRALASPEAFAGEGCPFATRCPHSVDVCLTTRPRPQATASGTIAACHRVRDLEVSAAKSAASPSRQQQGGHQR